MRLGFDASILASHTLCSGVGRYALRLLQKLPRSGQGLECVLFGLPGQGRPPGLPEAFPWQPLPSLRLGKISTFVAYQWALPRLAERWGIDLLHVPAVHTRPTWPSLPRRLPCPLVVTVHDLIPLTFYSRRHRLPARQRLFYRWNLGALQRAARAIVVSESSRREVLAHLPISPERVVTVLNGLDRPAEEGSPSGSRHVLCVASFEPRKNLPLLVRAYARAVEGGLSLPLVIVAEPGSGDERPVREALDWPALRDRLELRHHLSDDELSRLYREAAFVVCPSLAEGFGLPPLEAMAHGTAVIASDIPAHRELLGDAALFFPPEDGEALAQSLLRLAGNARLRERLVRSGREQAGLYSWERCAAETVAVYLEVVREATEGRARAARSLTRGREG